MNIVFTKDYTVEDAEGAKYKVGQKADMPPPSAHHFVNKGVAEYSVKGDKVPNTEETKPKKESKTPKKQKAINSPG